MLVFLIGVIAVALVGGLVPAVIAAVVGSLFLNYYFTPPLYTFTISEANNALALAVFVIVAVVVSMIVDDAARRSKQAARAGAESDLLVTTAGSILRGAAAAAGRGRPGPRGVRHGDRDPARARERAGRRLAAADWQAVADVGRAVSSTRPEDGDVAMPVSDDLCLAARGRTLPAADRRVLGAFAAYAAAALEQQRLTAEAEAARPIAEADRMRAGAARRGQPRPAHPAGLGQGGRHQPALATTSSGRPRTSAELLATADESLDKLTRLVENLLDMSRLQAGRDVGVPAARPTSARSSPARSTTSARAARRCSSRCPQTCPRCSSTLASWSA